MGRTARQPRRSAPLLALVLILGIAAMVVPAGAQALPADFWGVVANEAPRPEEAATLRAGGVESIRVPVNWGAVQSGPGEEPDWSSVDPYVRAAAESGISVLPFLVGAPGWVVHSEGVGGGTRAPVSLPVQTAAQRSAWREFLRLAVFRYGPGGSFWAENPLLPAHPIRTWQIWNEENFKYFAARPSPSQYGKLVVNSYRDLRSADPGARIVLGGLFGRPKGGATKPARGRIKRAYFAADFLEQMYKTTPGVRGKFLAVALHPYSYNYDQLTPQIEELREALKASRDGGRAIWLTELGWSSGHPSAANGHNGFEKGRAGQARELRGAFRLLRSKAAAWRVKRVYWFSFTDQADTCNFCDGSGLFGKGMKPKPAWSSYESFAR
jgi:polysaccharide biosynthesis protein PslG